MLRLLRTYASFVRFGHSVFALPFALVGVLLAAQETFVTPVRIGWIVAAMVTARTAAMGFNRIVDARFDALNLRTANRELPRGELSLGDAVWLVSAASLPIATRRFGPTLTRSNWPVITGSGRSEKRMRSCHV